MTLALFDLDNTLLNGDSDHAWGLYLADIGAVDAQIQRQKQDHFYQQYTAGSLNILEFCEYHFEVLTKHPMAQLQQWRADFINQIVQPMIDTGKAELLEKHRRLGHELLIVTATNDFITRPIAERLGVKHLIATQAEQINGRFTGKVAGVPSFRDGKVTRTQQWCASRQLSFDGSYFYSDSINDLPLLQAVNTPIAVTPDDRLRAHAIEHQWQIID